MEQNKLKVDADNLSPEEDQKRRYIQNQLYIHKCLKQNLKISNQKTSVNLGNQRNMLSPHQDESDIFRPKTKSMLSRNNSIQIDDDEEKFTKKQKQLHFSEIYEPAKSKNEGEGQKKIETNVESHVENWEESDDESESSIRKRQIYF